MSDTESPPLDHFDDHAARREQMRRDMLRAHTAVALVLFAVLALALLAVFGGLRAAENLRRAKAAEAEGQERLARAYTAQARACRASAEPGGRQTALAAVSNAAAIRAAANVRTEAMACLAMADLVQDGPLTATPPDLERVLTDPQLRHYARVSASNSITLISLRDGRQAAALPLDAFTRDARKDVSYLSFSPDGNLLAARFVQGAVAVWDLGSKRVVFSHGFGATNAPPPGRSFSLLTGMSFSRDSRKLVFNDAQASGQISVYDLAAGQLDSSAIPVWGPSFRMKPDMKAVAVANDSEVEVLKYPSGITYRSLSHEAKVAIMAWSPDGTRLAVSCDDGAVYIWDPERKIRRHLSGHSERCMRIGFSPDGNLLFTGSRDGTTRLWDVMQGRQIAAGNGLGHEFATDGARLGFWRPWAGFGTWRVSQSTAYSALEIDPADGLLLTLDLSAHGRWCVATQDKGFHIWDLSAANREWSFPSTNIVCGAFSPDEKTLYLTSVGGLEAWPLAPNPDGTLADPPSPRRKISLPDNRGARGIALSLDGRWAAVQLTDGRLIEIDLTEKEPPVALNGRFKALSFKAPASATGSGRFAISPDGRWVVTGNAFVDDTPRVWDGRTGALAARLKADTSTVGFSPDGRWLGLAGRERYSIWSVGDWNLSKTFQRDEPSLINGALAFASGGSLFAATRTRQSVQLRGGASYEDLGDLIPPTVQSVDSLRMSLDGSVLASSTPGGAVAIWRLDNIRQQLATLGLDWGGPPNFETAQAKGRDAGAGAWRITLLLILGMSVLAATLTILILRRHRLAIERFVTAEAQGADRDRELNAAKVELMRSQKMEALGTLAVGIAHDFNNLLSVVRMSNKLIGRETNGSAEIREHVNSIEHAVLQGKHVVSSMLGYVRAGAPTGQPTDAGAAVEATVALLSKEFLSGIVLTLEEAPGAPKVRIERGPLEQILLNLIINASEAMQGAGGLKITVRAWDASPARDYVLPPGAPGPCVELCVTDSGPGIAPSIRDRLFEPFFTTKRSSSKVGTGLGLSLVYAVARQNELGLAVESEPGRGAVFCVILPQAAGVRETHSLQDLKVV